MYASDPPERIVEELEFIVAERHQLQANGPHFRILYRCPGGQFAPCSSCEVVAYTSSMLAASLKYDLGQSS